MIPADIWALIGQQVVDTRALACVCGELLRALKYTQELTDARRIATGLCPVWSTITVTACKYYNRLGIVTVYRLVYDDNAAAFVELFDSATIDPSIAQCICTRAPKIFEWLIRRGRYLKSAVYSDQNAITYMRLRGYDTHIFHHACVSRKFIDFILQELPERANMLSALINSSTHSTKYSDLFYAYKKGVMPPDIVAQNAHNLEFTDCAEFIRENPDAEVDIEKMPPTYFTAVTSLVSMIGVIIKYGSTKHVPHRAAMYLAANTHKMTKAQLAAALSCVKNTSVSLNLLYRFAHDGDFCGRGVTTTATKIEVDRHHYNVVFTRRFVSSHNLVAGRTRHTPVHVHMV